MITSPAFSYTSSMSVILFGMRLLEVMFFVGIAGSAIVVVIATWEDMQELFSKTKHTHLQKDARRPDLVAGSLQDAVQHPWRLTWRDPSTIAVP